MFVAFHTYWTFPILTLTALSGCHPREGGRRVLKGLIEIMMSAYASALYGCLFAWLFFWRSVFEKEARQSFIPNLSIPRRGNFLAPPYKKIIGFVLADEVFFIFHFYMKKGFARRSPSSGDSLFSVIFFIVSACAHSRLASLSVSEGKAGASLLRIK